MALEPMAEFKKLTASLLTPTIRSPMANTANKITMYKYRFSMVYFSVNLLYFPIQDKALEFYIVS